MSDNFNTRSFPFHIHQNIIHTMKQISEGIFKFLQDIITGKSRKERYIQQLKKSDPEVKDAINKLEKNREKVRKAVDKTQVDTGVRFFQPDVDVDNNE